PTKLRCQNCSISNEPKNQPTQINYGYFCVIRTQRPLAQSNISNRGPHRFVCAKDSSYPYQPKPEGTRETSPSLATTKPRSERPSIQLAGGCDDHPIPRPCHNYRRSVHSQRDQDPAGIRAWRDLPPGAAAAVRQRTGNDPGVCAGRP